MGIDAVTHSTWIGDQGRVQRTMTIKLIGAALLALAVVASGAAAATPGDTPVDGPSDDRADQAPEEADPMNETAADAASGGADRANAAADGQRGPTADLPSQVPDFVGEVHDLVRQQIHGALDGDMGELVSGITPDEGGESAAGAEGDAIPA